MCAELGAPDGSVVFSLVDKIVDIPVEEIDEEDPPTLRDALDGIGDRLDALEQRADIVREWSRDQDELAEQRQAKNARVIIEVIDSVRKMSQAVSRLRKRVETGVPEEPWCRTHGHLWVEPLGKSMRTCCVRCGAVKPDAP